jgi:carbon-monoxide dehydrogenase large subunit
MDYPMPRAEDMPPLSIEHLDFPSPINELGIKGVGESGVVSPAAVIGGAVEDALWERGVRVSRVPLTPARIFQLLQSGKSLSPARGRGQGEGAIKTR